MFLAAWQYAHNLGASAIIRVLVGWNPLSLSVSVVFVSQQMVMLSVELLAEHKTIFVSVVYGHNLASDGLGLWRELRFVASSIGSAPCVTTQFGPKSRDRPSGC